LQRLSVDIRPWRPGKKVRIPNLHFLKILNQ